MALKFSTSLRNSRADAINSALNAGAGAAIVVIYSGTRPANAGTAPSGNTVLAKLTMSDPAAAAASGGVLTLSAITQDSSADNTGTASWFRCYSTADGSTINEANAVMDGDCGTSGSDMNLTTTSIVATQPVSITSWTLTEGGA